MIKVLLGDITELEVDAIVNAANNHLWMGTGVAGAIKKKGGVSIEEEAMSQGPIPVGGAVVTGAGSLKAQYVIHAAAMDQDLKTDAGRVRKAMRSALQRAQELALESIAFPALGTGAGGLNFETVSRVMVSEARRHLACGYYPREIIFALFDNAGYREFYRLTSRDAVVCLGDSITYGYPYGPEQSWVKICADRLRMNLINMGINGNTTRQMWMRFAFNVINLHPAYVIIMGGTNDAWTGTPLEKLQENVESMVNSALLEGICPVVGIPAPLNLAIWQDDELPGDVGYAAIELDSYREWLWDFASEEMLPVLDFYTPLINRETGQAEPSYFADDGHPNAEGYRVLAAAAEKLLEKMKDGL